MSRAVADPTGGEPPATLPDPAKLDDDAAIPDGPGDDIQIVSRDERSVPMFITGPIGKLDLAAPGESATKLLREIAATYLEASGTEEMIEPDVLVDEVGTIHVRVHESVKGWPVIGADLAIHADAKTGAVLSYNGNFMADDGWDTEPRLSADEAVGKALEELALPDARVVEDAKLVYVVSQVGYGVSLAFRVLVTYEDEDGPQSDYVFADSQTGVVMARHPTIYHAKHWHTHNAGGGYGLPGSLACSDNTSCADPTLQNIHNNVSKTYDYYQARFGRDSINNAGMTAVATGHYGVSYANAQWNGSQLAFGDGNGTQFSPLGNALDVVAHEFTHGVTQYESGLVNYNEPGALNEAWSDIFGAAVEAYRDGAVNANTWKIGEAVYTPSTAGDALRYMNYPKGDGVSNDYYPERYLGSADAGGVHTNSGIVNLAFYLLSQGGTHPRGKTANLVTGLGFAKAEQIFYRAQKYHYITSNTDMKGARHATALAAYQLYGKPGFRAVHQAWCAVGVPDCPAYRPIDKVYTGDFDGDGRDEVLVVYSNGDMNMFKYVGGIMQCIWGNGGNPNAGGGIYPYRNNLLVGDFDGDGKTDLLGTGGWITMFHFYGGDWHWGWSNYGNTSAGGGIYPYRNNLIAGDFDGDGRTDLLGGGGWMTMFHFYGGDWHWGWSNYGNTSAGGGIYPYRNKLIAGDFDGDGRTDLLGVASWMTMFHFYGGDWHWGWSNYGNPSGGGGIVPYQNSLVVGDYDGDGHDDVLGTGGWITMFRFYGGDWHWGFSNYGSTSAGNGIYPYRNRLVPGKFDGTTRDRLLGVNTWNTMFSFENDQNFHWGWSDYGDSLALGMCN